MKDWNGTQRQFILDHLGADMTGEELGRLFMVNPAEIYQVYRAKMKRLPRNLKPTAFHSPGGGRLLAMSYGVKGATRADIYDPMPHDEFQHLYRPAGWVRP